MGKKVMTFCCRSAVSAIIFVLLLIPYQTGLPLFDGVDLKPSACLNVVLGIFWGVPAAVGVTIGSFFYDLVFSQPNILFGVIVNGPLTLLARYLFFLPVPGPMRKGQYIYDLSSLLKYIVTSLIIALLISVPYDSIITGQYGEQFLLNYSSNFNLNFHTAIVLGIPIMFVLPRFIRWADESSSAQEKDQALYGYMSLGSIAARRVMMLGILAAIILCFYIVQVFKSGASSLVDTRLKVFHLFSVVDIFFLLFGAASFHFIQKRFVTPLKDVASRLSIDGEQFSNELDIISKRLDFVVSGTVDLISGNEYSIIIGLTTKDFSKRYSLDEARLILDAICLSHVKGKPPTNHV